MVEPPSIHQQFLAANQLPMIQTNGKKPMSSAAVAAVEGVVTAGGGAGASSPIVPHVTHYRQPVEDSAAKEEEEFAYPRDDPLSSISARYMQRGTGTLSSTAGGGVAAQGRALSSHEFAQTGSSTKSSSATSTTGLAIHRIQKKIGVNLPFIHRTEAEIIQSGADLRKLQQVAEVPAAGVRLRSTTRYGGPGGQSGYYATRAGGATSGGRGMRGDSGRDHGGSHRFLGGGAGWVVPSPLDERDSLMQARKQIDRRISELEDWF